MAVLVSLKQKLVSKNRMFKLPKPEAVNWIELDANEWELILRKPVMTVQEFAYCSIGAMIPPRKWDGSIIEEITKSVTAKTDLALGINWRNHETNIHIEATELMEDFIRTVSERGDVLRNNAISGDLGVSYPNPDAPRDPYYKIKDMIEFARNNGWELPPQLSNEITQKVELATDTTPTDKVELVTDTSQKSDAKPWLIQNPNDPDPKQPWYIPARYFARQLVRNDSTLLVKRNILAQQVRTSLSAVGIFKRGGKKPFDSTTILKAFANCAL